MPYRKKRDGLKPEEVLAGLIFLGAMNPDGTMNTIAKKPIKAGQPVILEIDIDKGVVYSEPVELKYNSKSNSEF